MDHVVHVVLLRWRAEASPEDREEVRAGIRSLQESIPGIVGLVEGPSVSTEALERGLDYGFVVTFASLAARDEYLPHPAHRAVAERIVAAGEQITVFDLGPGA